MAWLGPSVVHIYGLFYCQSFGNWFCHISVYHCQIMNSTDLLKVDFIWPCNYRCIGLDCLLWSFQCLVLCIPKVWCITVALDDHWLTSTKLRGWLLAIVPMAEVFVSIAGRYPGPWLNIKMSSYQYRKSHCGDKTILWPSYLHNGISYTGKTTSLYWIWTQGLDPLKRCHITGVGIPIIDLQWSDKHLRSVMVIPIQMIKGLPNE